MGGGQQSNPEATGWEPSLNERLANLADPHAIVNQATADALHLLGQFGIGGKEQGLQPVSNEEMMRRYPGLRLPASQPPPQQPQQSGVNEDQLAKILRQLGYGG